MLVIQVALGVVVGLIAVGVLIAWANGDFG